MVLDSYNYSKEKTVSDYQPSEEVKGVTLCAQKTFEKGYEILHKGYTEYNGNSFIQEEDMGERMFNQFVDIGEENPDEAWKYRGTRSKARNKGVVTYADLTANYLIPTYLAQNESDDIDEAFSEFMRDIVEWMTYPTNSDYQPAFLTAVMGAITSPMTWVTPEFFEIYQNIKIRQEDGSIQIEEILDEVASGFRLPVMSVGQVLIGNAYERNTQKQVRVMTTKMVEIETLEAAYGEHDNWKYVEAGKRSVFNSEDDTFYDIYDDDNVDMCELAIEKCRMDDTEIPFINGIYFGDSNVDENPIKHRDNRNAPKYNLVPFGYYRIGKHFAGYKSMMSTLRWDNGLYDAMTELVMNRAILETDMPMAFMGTDQIDTNVVFPGAMMAFKNPDTKVQPLLPNSNLGAGFNALQSTDDSMDESSLSDTQSGQLPSKASTKAVAISQASVQAKKILGNVGKSIAESVVLLGDLMKDIAINNVTAPQAEELVSGEVLLKYKSFILPEKSIGGKMVSKVIKFDESMLGKEETEEARIKKNLSMLSDVDYPENKKHLYTLNPEMFSNFKYMSRSDYKELFKENNESMQVMLTNLYTLLGQDPYVKHDMLLSKVLYSYFQSEGYEMINKELPQQQEQQQDPNAQGQPAQGGGSLNSMLQGKALASHVNSTGVMQ